MSLIEQFFTTISAHSKRFRRRYDDDFMLPWSKIDDLCNESNFKKQFNTTWSSQIRPGGILYESIVTKAMDLPEKIINGYGDEELLEENHFMIQIYRITLNQPVTIRNVCQIAYFIGLVTARFRIKDFPEGMVRTINQLNAFRLSNFVSKAVIDKMNTLLVPDDLTNLKNTLKNFDKDYSTIKINNVIYGNTGDETSSNDSG